MKLDFFKLLENLGIGCIGFELFKIIAVIDKSVADKLGKKLCKLRVGLAESTAVSNTVGNVCELVGSERIEILENTLLENLRMESRNAVYAV